VGYIEDLATWSNKHDATSLISRDKVYFWNHFIHQPPVLRKSEKTPGFIKSILTPNDKLSCIVSLACLIAVINFSATSDVICKDSAVNRGLSSCALLCFQGVG
jgi:hypothetical protein